MPEASKILRARVRKGKSLTRHLSQKGHKKAGQGKGTMGALARPTGPTAGGTPPMTEHRVLRLRALGLSSWRRGCICLQLACLFVGGNRSGVRGNPH